MPKITWKHGDLEKKKIKRTKKATHYCLYFSEKDAACVHVPAVGKNTSKTLLAPQTARPWSSGPLSFWKSLGLQQDGRGPAETVSDQSIPLLSLLSTRAWGAAPACSRGRGMLQVLSLFTQCLTVAREVKQARQNWGQKKEAHGLRVLAL